MIIEGVTSKATRQAQQRLEGQRASPDLPPTRLLPGFPPFGPRIFHAHWRQACWLSSSGITRRPHGYCCCVHATLGWQVAAHGVSVTSASVTFAAVGDAPSSISWRYDELRATIRPTSAPQGKPPSVGRLLSAAAQARLHSESISRYSTTSPRSRTVPSRP